MKKTTRPQTRQCADCTLGNWDASIGAFDCTVGHKPRFYKPRHSNDTEWGWKRKCKDFRPICF